MHINKKWKEKCIEMQLLKQPLPKQPKRLNNALREETLNEMRRLYCYQEKGKMYAKFAEKYKNYNFDSD